MVRVILPLLMTAVATVFAMGLLAPAEASACSPPPPGWDFFVEEPMDDMPLDGAVTFRGVIVTAVHSDPESVGGNLEFTVTGPEDTTVDGTTRFVLLSERTWLDFHASDVIRTYFIAWAPQSPLEPETEYHFQVKQGLRPM